MKVGDRVESLNFGWMQCISEPYISGNKRNEKMVDVLFERTGHIRKRVLTKTFWLGAVRDGSIEAVRDVGTRYRSSGYGWVEILIYENSKSVTVRFEETGHTQKIQLDNLLTGLFSDEIVQQQRLEESKLRCRILHETRTAEIAEANRRKEEAESARAKTQLLRRQRKEAAIKRKQEVGAKRAKEHSQSMRLYVDRILNNLDQNPPTLTKSGLNLDFKDRHGEWVLSFTDKITGKEFKTRLGRLHNNVTQRGNSQGRLQAFHHSSYSGVSVSEEFMDGQKFCEWAVQQVGWGMGFDLDKDLLKRGNREYCRECCVFLPPEINMTIRDKYAGDLLMGAYWSKDAYHSQIGINGLQWQLGKFSTEIEAHEAYCEFKELYVKELADKYKSKIDKRAYDALMSWSVN